MMNRVGAIAGPSASVFKYLRAQSQCAEQCLRFRLSGYDQRLRSTIFQIKDAVPSIFCRLNLCLRSLNTRGFPV